MITSVGRDAITACASIRAGLTRPQELTSFPLLDVETCEESSLIGHPVEGFSEGFVAAGAWLRLGLACLDNLVAAARLPGPDDERFWQRTGLLLVVPALLASRFGQDANDPRALQRGYLDRLLSLWGRPLPRTATGLVASGNAGAIAGLERARALLVERSAERVILLGADSYLDALSLECLWDASRLKTTENPAGLAPGEGAACLLLESAAAARQRGASVQAVISTLASGQDGKAFIRDELSQGEGLGLAFTRCLSDANEPPFEGDLVTDLNGEAWRAQELAGATMRAADLIRSPRWIYPAASLGDTGAASGAISLCVAARALARGYARGGRVLVAASSEDGQVGAATMTTG